MKLFSRLISFMQKRCSHSRVTADILEGDHGEPVRHCQQCGAVQRGIMPHYWHTV